MKNSDCITIQYCILKTAAHKSLVTGKYRDYMVTVSSLG